MTFAEACLHIFKAAGSVGGIGWSRKWLFLLSRNSKVAVSTKIRIITRGRNYVDHPRAEPPRGAEPRFELGPTLQQASALTSVLRCTPMKYNIKNDAIYHLRFTALKSELL
jgi:hypothetical protein